MDTNSKNRIILHKENSKKKPCVRIRTDDVATGPWQVSATCSPLDADRPPGHLVVAWNGSYKCFHLVVLRLFTECFEKHDPRSFTDTGTSVSHAVTDDSVCAYVCVCVCV